MAAMDLARLPRIDETTWRIDPHGAMRVPAIVYGDERLISDMDDKVYEQVVNVAMLPGIVQASYAMPDAHWGYGFPIGGVAAFDAERGGVVSATRTPNRSEEHTSELQSLTNLVCRLLLEKKK